MNIYILYILLHNEYYNIFTHFASYAHKQQVVLYTNFHPNSLILCLNSIQKIIYIYININLNGTRNGFTKCDKKESFPLKL